MATSFPGSSRAYNWFVDASSSRAPFSWKYCFLISQHYRYISAVAAACMVLYGYDASVYNAVQGSKHWIAWFNNPDPNMIGAVNTAYTVGAIVGGFFFGGPIADFFGRKIGMATGCVLVIIATFMQAFAPRNSLGCFLAGRCIIGVGQGIALSKFCSSAIIAERLD